MKNRIRSKIGFGAYVSPPNNIAPRQSHTRLTQSEARDWRGHIKTHSVTARTNYCAKLIRLYIVLIDSVGKEKKTSRNKEIGFWLPRRSWIACDFSWNILFGALADSRSHCNNGKICFFYFLFSVLRSFFWFFDFFGWLPHFRW